MGTTRIKVIDLSSDQGQIKTSRKHAEKLSGLEKLKEKKPQKQVHHPKDDQPMAEKDQKPLIAQTADISEATGSDVASPSETAETPTLRTTDTTESSEPSQPSESSASSQPSKPSPAKTHSKKYKNAASLVDNSRVYSANEAVDFLYKTSTTSFDPTVELHLNVADKSIKGSVNLPFPVKGKKKQTKYLIFADKRLTINDKPIIWGDLKTIEEIEKGTLKAKRDFDTVIASAKFMPQLAKVAKILGPAGLMPNPKNGTITDDPTKALAQNQSSAVTYKSDPTVAVIHTTAGKLSQKTEEISGNIKAIVSSIGPKRIKKATLTSTMGPGIKFDVATL